MHARAILEYSLLGLLLLVLAGILLDAALFGDDPRPQTPPDNYVASESTVLLGWTRGDEEGSLRVQLMEGDHFSIKDDGKQTAPLLIDKETKSETMMTPPLEAGKRFCWRVTRGTGGTISCFETNPSYIAF